MVFWSTLSSRNALSPQQSLEFAKVCLDNARNSKDAEIALQLCSNAETALSQAKRVVKTQKHSEDHLSLSEDIAAVYIELGKLQDCYGQGDKAHANYKKAEQWVGHTLEVDRPAQIYHHSGILHPTKDVSLSGLSIQSTDSLTLKQFHSTDSLSQQIFPENIRPPAIVFNPPEADQRLDDTPQLACCLNLLRASPSLDDVLEPAARDWLQAIENDTDEQERLKTLARDVIRAFKSDELKDSKAIAEVIYLAPVLEKDDFRYLLKEFYSGVDQSDLLNVQLLEGFAELMQGADPGYLDSDDLVKTLDLLSTRLRDTHQQSSHFIYQLTQAVSRVLDAMADTKVKGLDRERLHEPLSSYLESLKGSSDPFLVYQAAYAYQALQYVPDNETLWQATLRRTGKVIKGMSGLVSAVKGFDLNSFVEGLQDIQQGLAGALEAAQLVKTAIGDVASLVEGGKDFLDCLKEGFSFTRKCTWYPALRGADTLLREGQLAKFRKLVCEAPCRLDLAFQWGVCQRLGEVAANPMWDTDTRQGAIGFLGEIYQHEEQWGKHRSIKQWILDILVLVSSPSENDLQLNIVAAAKALLLELESNASSNEQGLLQSFHGSYPLRFTLPSLASPSLLDRVQNRPDVEGSLRLLKKLRLKDRGSAVYIPPQAKASLQASDDARFPLMEKVKEFLNSDQKVLLLLGDSGAGKSTFNRQLEYDLWEAYKNKNDPIPLHINLPAIDKPHQDMVTKQLQKAGFVESQIRELKAYRKLVLICDGYDESQQTKNLYVSNRLNEPGEWNAQMVISCRSEAIGTDYRDRFQPRDRKNQAKQALFQEAVISSFSADQVQDYIRQYVALHQPLWKAEDYQRTLDLIPSLKELVKNPFLLTLSLEVLPRMVDPGQRLTASRVTRVALYDQFVEQWLERGKKRLGERELSHQARGAFESLSDEGFALNGMDYLKKLSVAIYKEQDGQPVVEYSRFKDEGTWKAAFFSREDETQLLREASPLTRSGNQYRFIHRSLLEYGLALSVYDPQDIRKTNASEQTLTRRRSTSSIWSFEADGGLEEVTSTVAEQEAIEPHSALVWKRLVNEPSVLQFLSERAQQEPVFKRRLFDYIEYSKTDKRWRIAAANSITVLVRAGVQFNGTDLEDIKIPGADLSYGVFHSAQLQRADLRKVSLRGTWLRQADLSKARVRGIQFGQLPFLREDSEVLSCAYSPDGMTFAVGLSIGTVRVYSVSTWERLWTLSGHTGRVECVVYSPASDWIASAGNDDAVRIWDVEAGSCYCILTGHTNSVTSVAFSAHGGIVASASADNTVRLWDVKTKNCTATLSGHTDQVLSVAFSPKSDQVASSSEDTTIRLWDVESRTCRQTLTGRTWVRGVVYSPQGDLVASANDDRVVRLWDTETGACRQVLTGHEDRVKGIAFSPRGDMIASTSGDKTVRLWDKETGACLQTLTGHSGMITSVVFSPNGDQIATGSNDRTVRLWDIGGSSRQVTTGHGSGVFKVRYSSLGNQFATCSRDKTVRLWDSETGACSHILSGHDKWVLSVVYSPHRDQVASASDDGTVRLWEAQSGNCQHILQGHSKTAFSIAYSPCGHSIASGSMDTTVRVWDVETGQCRQILIGHTEWVWCVIYSPKGGQISSSSADRTVRIWDVENEICRHVLSGHRGAVKSIAYSINGDMIVSASDDKTLRLWDTETGTCRHILAGHEDAVFAVTYSPNGKQLASASLDETVKLWDAETGVCLHTLTGHDDEVRGVTYSPQGDMIASFSYDKTVRLWDVASGQCRAVIRDFYGWVLDATWVTGSDVKQLAASCNDGSWSRWSVKEDGNQCQVVQLWRSTNGQLTMTGSIIQDVSGLSQLNKELLKQLGTRGEPDLRKT